MHFAPCIAFNKNDEMYLKKQIIKKTHGHRNTFQRERESKPSQCYYAGLQINKKVHGSFCNHLYSHLIGTIVSKGADHCHLLKQPAVYKCLLRVGRISEL